MIAVWKPWDTGDEGSDRLAQGSSLASVIATDPRPPSPSPSAVPSPTPTGTPSHPDAVACISATGWRVVTRDVTAGRESRTWIAISPTEATGPGDESIPTVRTVVGRLMAIGYCLPAELPAELSDVQPEARLWLIGPDDGVASPRPTRPRPEAAPIEMSPLHALAPHAPGFADLFTPPSPDRRWVAGTYVFAVDLDRTDGPVWFSVEVVDSAPVPN